MPYLGTHAVGFSKTTKDRFSVITLLLVSLCHKSNTVTDIQVFVDNIRQEPTIAYSVSGATLDSRKHLLGRTMFTLFINIKHLSAIPHKI